MVHCEEDVVKAVLDALNGGIILREVNTIVITLVPKIKCPQTVSEYRPILVVIQFISVLLKYYVAD